MQVINLYLKDIKTKSCQHEQIQDQGKNKDNYRRYVGKKKFKYTHYILDDNELEVLSLGEINWAYATQSGFRKSRSNFQEENKEYVEDFNLLSLKMCVCTH